MTTHSNKNYIVYLTMYSGNLLPQWYIGSTYEQRITDGYNGCDDIEKVQRNI